MQEISKQDIISQRLLRNGVHAPFSSPCDCVHALAGIQSQFQQWAEVSVMNRCPDVTMAKFAELYNQHDIINLWGQRHTLHLYTKEDWRTVSDIYEPWLSGKSYASKSPDDMNHLIKRIAAEYPSDHLLSREKIISIVDEHTRGRDLGEYFAYTFIALGCLRGLFFGLPDKPAIKSFVSGKKLNIEPWTRDAKRLTAALDDYVLRYFRYYGPATIADFSHWSGLSQKLTKECVGRLSDRFEIYQHNGKEYYAYGQTPDGSGGLALLGKFDPLFVSYKHKDWAIPPKFEKQVWRSAGWVEGVILDDDKALGTWRHSLKGRKMSIDIEAFGKISAAARKSIRHKAEKLAVFWEKELDKLDFV